jgi:predicted nucleotidyltransferase
MTEDALLKRLGIDAGAIAIFCHKWGIVQLEVFGSVLGTDFHQTSDVDLLVTFGESARRSLWDLFDMQEELKGLLERDVDLVERPVLQRSRNYIRRAAILSSARVLYAA